jgi:hypothetical protein
MKTILLVLLGLVLALPVAAQQRPQKARSADEAKRQRERAIERCKANRGTDCTTDAGLAEWLQQERSRSEAKAQGSRSIHQTAPKPAPRPSN